MNDVSAIRKLQLDYAVFFDARDAVAFANLYTDDATVFPPTGKSFSGREKLLKAVINAAPGGWHRPLEPIIEVNGDVATSRCPYEAEGNDGGYYTGYYDDEYRRTADGWRIAKRKVIVETYTPKPD
jgi:ketosteroid isomerase-like protein